MSVDGQRPELVDDRADAGMDHASAVRGVFHAASFGNVSSWHVVIAGNGRIGGQFVTWDRILVRSVEKYVSGIVMDGGQRNAKFLRDVQSKRSENRMAAAVLGARPNYYEHWLHYGLSSGAGSSDRFRFR
jgi:hypothetical protein